MSPANARPRKAHRSRPAFTLIELLIVIAIIAILALIAVPNFLEAQVRAKVSRAHADMRTIDTALQSYVVDWGNEPRVTRRYPSPDNVGRYSSWWGFTSMHLTTPVAYIASLPPQPFLDQHVFGFWRQLGGTKNNQPYTIIRRTEAIARGTGNWTPDACTATNPTFANVPIYADFVKKARRSGYILYTCGPDNSDGTVWRGVQPYDSSNGTMSFGDIYRFGDGSPYDDDTYN